MTPPPPPLQEAIDKGFENRKSRSVLTYRTITVRHYKAIVEELKEQSEGFILILIHLLYFQASSLNSCLSLSAVFTRRDSNHWLI